MMGYGVCALSGDQGLIEPMVRAPLKLKAFDKALICQLETGKWLLWGLPNRFFTLSVPP